MGAIVLPGRRSPVLDALTQVSPQLAQAILGPRIEQKQQERQQAQQQPGLDQLAQLLGLEQGSLSGLGGLDKNIAAPVIQAIAQQQFAKPQPDKPPLTPNETFNQIRAQAKFEIDSALAPFRNAFGGIDLASKEQRQALNKKIQNIQDRQEKQLRSAAKKLGVADFDPQEFLAEVPDLNAGPQQQKRKISREEAAQILQEAGGDKERAREIARQRNLEF